MPQFKNVSAGLELSAGSAASLSESSQAALATAIWAARGDGGHLHLLAGLDVDAFTSLWLRREEDAGRANTRTELEARLTVLAKDARTAGVSATSVAVPIGSPADVLVEDAERADRDLIVVGTRERGEIARNLLGSTALGLVRRARRSVWIARAPYPAPAAAERDVLCAIDFGDMAPRIVATAARIAAAAGANLTVVHVANLKAADVLRAGAADAAYIAEHRRARRERAEREIPAIVAGAAHGVKADVRIVDGDANETIVEQTKDTKAGLLVVGSVVHGAAVAAVLGLGRTAEYVLANAKTSILVLKP